MCSHCGLDSADRAHVATDGTRLLCPDMLADWRASEFVTSVWLRLQERGAR